MHFCLNNILLPRPAAIAIADIARGGILRKFAGGGISAAAVTQVCFGLTQTARRQNRPQKNSKRSSSMLLQRCSIYSEEHVYESSYYRLYIYIIYYNLFIFLSFFYGRDPGLIPKDPGL